MKHADNKEPYERTWMANSTLAKRAAVEQHLKSCGVCEGELRTLRDHAARVRDGLDRLPELPERR